MYDKYENYSYEELLKLFSEELRKYFDTFSSIDELGNDSYKGRYEVFYLKEEEDSV